MASQEAEEKFPIFNANLPQTWIILGDIHDDCQRLGEISGLPDATGVLITGDLTKLGGKAAARAVIESIAAYNPVILAQFGNMDRPEVGDYLTELGINMHATVRHLTPDVALMGVGGSTFTPFGTPSEFPEARFGEWLEEVCEKSRPYSHRILVSHNPPLNSVADKTGTGMHVGSEALRECLEEYQPDICICGHIHESVGQQKLGRTLVVNPGSFLHGAYAVLHIDNEISVSLHRLE